MALPDHFNVRALPAFFYVRCSSSRVLSAHYAEKPDGRTSLSLAFPPKGAGRTPSLLAQAIQEARFFKKLHTEHPRTPVFLEEKNNALLIETSVPVHAAARQRLVGELVSYLRWAGLISAKDYAAIQQNVDGHFSAKHGLLPFAWQKFGQEMGPSWTLAYARLKNEYLKEGKFEEISRAAFRAYAENRVFHSALTSGDSALVIDDMLARKAGMELALFAEMTRDTQAVEGFTAERAFKATKLVLARGEEEKGAGLRRLGSGLQNNESASDGFAYALAEAIAFAAQEKNYRTTALFLESGNFETPATQSPTQRAVHLAWQGLAPKDRAWLNGAIKDYALACKEAAPKMPKEQTHSVEKLLGELVPVPV